MFDKSVRSKQKEIKPLYSKAKFPSIHTHTHTISRMQIESYSNPRLRLYPVAVTSVFPQTRGRGGLNEDRSAFSKTGGNPFEERPFRVLILATTPRIERFSGDMRAEVFIVRISSPPSLRSLSLQRSRKGLNFSISSIILSTFSPSSFNSHD